MALTCIISEIKRDIGGRKPRFVHTPLHTTPQLGVLRRNIASLFFTEKPEWWRYLTVKNFEDMFSVVNRILACDGQTHGRIDRHLAMA